MQNNLPLNWCECKLEDLCEVISKGATPKNQTEKPNYAKFLKAENITKASMIDLTSCKYIDKETYTTALKRSILKKNDILITIAGTLGRCAVVETEENLNTNQAVCFVRLLNCGISPHFIKYYALSPVINKRLTGKAKVTAIPNLTLEIIKNINVALPPLAEQERIVEKIEALFADIDTGVEKLKATQAQIKQYRQSVLKSAFEGKLYKTTEWKKSTLEQHIQEINYGTSEKTKDFGKIPVFRMGDIQEGKLTFNNFKYLNKINDEKLILKKGDLLFNRTNSAELVGKSAVFNHEGSYSFASYIIKVRFDTSLDSNFICYYINSPKGRNWAKTQISQQVGQANINGTKLKNLPFPLPTLSEQQHIVEEIEKRFAVADELEKAVNEGLEKADKLKQSILKKAFEGKLVAQNPNDEPASILLDRIKKEQKPTKGKKK